MSLTPEDARKTAVPRKVTKEPKWNGGMTHKRSILGTRMMELLGRLADYCVGVPVWTAFSHTAGGYQVRPVLFYFILAGNGNEERMYMP